ncbi:MAG: hypothetical protein AB1696_17690 [Planctomycetota bacterium]
MIQAGAARADITPDPKLTDIPVHDPIEARALVVRDESTAVGVMSCDVRSIRWDFIDRLRKRVEESTGIPFDHVAVHCTHNHTNLAVWRHHFNNVPPDAPWEPADVLDDLMDRMLACFREAHADCREVRVATASGAAEGVAASARVALKDGRWHWVKGNSPMPHDDEIAGRGPYDPQVLVLRLIAPNGEHVAHVVNFACHPTADIGGSHGISADYPGFAMRNIEHEFGGIALYLNGPNGDIHPADYMNRRGMEFARDLGKILSDAVIALDGQFKEDHAPRVGAAKVPLTLPRRRRSTSAELHALMEERQRLCDELAVRVGPAMNLEQFLPLYRAYLAGDLSQAGRVADYLRLLRTMERICANAVDVGTVHGMPEEGLRHMLPAGSDENQITIEVQAFRVGDMAFVFLPGEQMAETGLRIKADSPFDATAVVSYTNGGIGYMPTDDMFEHFVYPVQYSITGKGATEVIRCGARQALEGLRRRSL